MIVERVISLCPEQFSLFIVDAFAEESNYIRNLIQDLYLFETANRTDGEGIFVIKLEQKIVGLLFLVRDSKPNHERYALLKHLYILPQARNKGYATVLVNFVIEYATHYYDSISLQSRLPFMNRILVNYGFKEVSDHTYAMPLITLNQ